MLLLILSFLDLLVLKRIDKSLSLNEFNVSSKIYFPLFLSLVAMVYAADEKMFAFHAFVMIVAMPLYFLRRNKFYQQLDSGKNFDGQTLLDAEGLSTEQKRWLISKVLHLMIIWIYVMNLCSALLKAIAKIAVAFEWTTHSLRSIQLFNGLLMTVVLYVIGFYLINLFIRNSSTQGFWATLGFDSANISFNKKVVVPIILGLFCAFNAAYIIVSRKIQPETPLSQVLQEVGSPATVLLLVFLAIIAAPLVEEIIFRGFFYKMIRLVWGPRAALYLVALAFALLHVAQYWTDWSAILVVAILSLILTMLRAWSGTTLASTIMHYVYNGGVTIITMIMLFVSNPSYFQYMVYHDHLDKQTRKELLKKSLEKDPNLPEAQNALALHYVEEGKNLEEALLLINKALVFDSDNKEFKETKQRIVESLND